MSLEQHPHPGDGIDPAVVQLLGHRYGDGLVYLSDAGERGAFQRAVLLGLVSAEGYLTPAGMSVLARHDFD